MHRMVLRSLALTVVLFLPLVAVPAWAQEASPPGDGETIEQPVDLPAAPAELVVRWLTLEPGEQIPLHPHPQLEIVFVVAGSATLRTAEGPTMRGVRGDAEVGAAAEAAGPGSELTVAAGDAVIVPPGNVHEGRAGNGGVTVMLFGFASRAGEEPPGT